MKSLLAKAVAAAVICMGMFAVLAAPALAQGGYPIDPPTISVVPSGTGTDGTGGLGGAFGPTGADATGGAAGTGDEVLGISQTPGDTLAITGSSVNLPVAAAAGLIGAGSITLLVARKRRS